MNCEKVCELTVAYLDNELKDTARDGVEEHLRTCDHCRAKVEELTRAMHVVASFAEGEPTAEAWRGLQTKIFGNTEERYSAGERRGDLSLSGLRWCVLRHRLAAVTAVIVMGLVVFLAMRTGRRSSQQTAGSSEPVGRLRIVCLAAPLASRYTETVISSGDLVATDAFERAIFTLRGKHVVDMNCNTTLVVERFIRQGSEADYALHLGQGEIWLNVKENGNEFCVQTDVARIRAIGTQFDVRVGENGSTIVTVDDGSVVVVTQLAKVVLQAGYQASVDSGGRIASPRPVSVAQATSGAGR